MSDARTVLFERLIDDAGLFPPARKPMTEAVADHRAARQGPAAWMLRRFLCPASRLEELDAAGVGSDWELGAILATEGDDWGAGVGAELERVRAYRGGTEVRALELRLPPASSPGELVRRAVDVVEEANLSQPVELFLEVPVTDEDGVVSTLEAIAEARAAAEGRYSRSLPAAKIRCGGPSAQDFPPDEVVAAFISRCRRLGLPFKATAGLHHPFRQPDADTGALQHGFLNLLAAAALPEESLAAAVLEPRADAFAISAGGIGWRGKLAGPDAIARARRVFVAVGSCSFNEPLEELAAHGVLPAKLADTAIDA